MTRGPNKFKQRELTRAIKAVREAGVEKMTVEVDRLGTLRILCNPAASEPQGDGEESGWAGAR